MARTAGKQPSPAIQSVTTRLEPLRPYRLDLTVWALRRQPHNIVDAWDGTTYTRIFDLDGQPVRAAVAQEREGSLRVSLSSTGPISADEVVRLTSLLSTMLGTGVDLRGFYRLARTDDQLKHLAREFTGFRPPRFPSLSEALANAVACQQISLNVCITLLDRLAAAYGLGFKAAEGLRSFPSAAALASADPVKLRELGFSRTKAAALIGLSRSIMNGELNLDTIAGMDDTEAIDALREIRGIGRWSAEYVLLRGLGRLNIFPGDDAGALNNLRSFLSLPERPGSGEAGRILKRWDPYQGLVYFHFLLRKLKAKGLV